MRRRSSSPILATTSMSTPRKPAPRARFTSAPHPAGTVSVQIEVQTVFAVSTDACFDLQV